MGKIIWLASYPRSGSTWLRTLLTNYIKNKDTPISINQLLGGPLGSSRQCFNEWVGVNASSLTDSLILNLRPHVYRSISRHSKEILFIRVHDRWHRTDSGEALFPEEITEGIVYIIRNPLAVAVSNKYFWNKDIEKSVEMLCNDNFSLSQSKNKLSTLLEQHLGSWGAHAQSWVDRPKLPLLLIRYEDLFENTEKTFGEVVKFCHLDYDLPRLQKAIRHSQLSELQKQEKNFGFQEHYQKSLDFFFRKGKINSWKDEIPKVLIHKLKEKNGEAMRRFEYPIDY